MTASPTAPADLLAESIGSWVAKQPAKPLVFALEHHYTERGLSLDLLKGADRQLADLVVSAAEKADCLVHLAQVSRHLIAVRRRWQLRRRLFSLCTARRGGMRSRSARPTRTI